MDRIARRQEVFLSNLHQRTLEAREYDLKAARIELGHRPRRRHDRSRSPSERRDDVKHYSHREVSRDRSQSSTYNIRHMNSHGKGQRSDRSRSRSPYSNPGTRNHRVRSRSRSRSRGGTH